METTPEINYAMNTGTKYKHIFFDLDHTLWDFDKNAEETIHELFVTYNLKNLGLHSADIFIERYTYNNHLLWADYHIGKISKQQLRETRFKKTFTELGVEEKYIPMDFEDDYVRICPTKTNLFPETHETLSYLKNKYQLHLISNGFKESTECKLANTGLETYFQNIVISEIIGINKPDKAIFEYALNLAEGAVSESVMIGDSIEADIRGAKNFGMDAVYFNPKNADLPDDIDHQINQLSELRTFL